MMDDLQSYESCTYQYDHCYQAIIETNETTLVPRTYSH